MCSPFGFAGEKKQQQESEQIPPQQEITVLSAVIFLISSAGLRVKTNPNWRSNGLNGIEPDLFTGQNANGLSIRLSG